MANGIKRFKELSKDYMSNPNILRNMLKDMQELCEELQAENAQLKDQLRWRPVSEKPEKDGEYFVKFNYADGEEGMDVCDFTNGEWFWDDIISWLPIPPSPEGE